MGRITYRNRGGVIVDEHYIVYIHSKPLTAKNEAIGLKDYKFFCFGGRSKMLYVSEGLENHSTAHISFFDMNGKQLPFRRIDYAPLGDNLALPTNFNELISIANTLANGINCPFVRIDLYSIQRRTYFSEITFFPCGGMIPFVPSRYDEELGAEIVMNLH